ncbi:MAG TPA: diguanylate cyclase [Stellaceae bacterium]
MSVAARLWLSAILTIAVLAGETVLVRWIVSKSDDLVKERVASRESLAQTEDVLAILINAETGQRGYLLTGLDRYLVPYQDALGDLPEATRKLNAAAVNSTQLRPRIARLDRLSQAKMDELRKTIAVRRNQGLDAAQKTIAGDAGKELMDAARTTAGEIEAILQAEIDRKSTDVRRMHKWLFASLVIGSLVIAFAILIINLLIVRSIEQPLNALREGIARIAAGDLTHDIVVRGRDELNRLAQAFNAMTADLRAERFNRERAETEVVRTETALKARGLELEQRARTIDLLGRMANRLPSCTDEREFIEVVRRYVPQIFPGLPGALYALSNSQTVLRRIVDWNDPAGSTPEFSPLECWGLRRGQPHVIADVTTDVVCAHVHPEQLTGYRCVPLVAQGETVGLLFLEERQGRVAVDERYLQVMTETVASSLVNLRLRERLRNQSIRDPLTGLFNRRYLEESLELECARADRAKQPLSVVMVDIDHFKRFNDEFGHDAGDVVLKNVGELLRHMLRQGDVACRYGGEEFLLVLLGTSAQEAFNVCERIRAATLKLEVAHRGQPLGKITMSFGIATFPAAGDTPAAIITAADQALYAAKAGGRDRVEIFETKQASSPETVIPA